MISLHDYRTEDALPAEMKTPERLASCRVFDIHGTVAPGVYLGGSG